MKTLIEVYTYFSQSSDKVGIVKRAIQHQLKRAMQFNSFLFLIAFVSFYNQDVKGWKMLYINLFWYIPLSYFLAIIREIKQEIDSI